MDTGFATQLLDAARHSGAEQAEVFLKSASALSIEAKHQAIETLEKSTTAGYCLRVIRDGRLGFSYATEPAAWQRVVELAVEASRHAEPDDYNGLASTSGYADVAVYDDAVAMLPETDAIHAALMIEKAARDTDPRITKIRKAASSFTTAETRILSSLGVDVAYRATACSAQVMAVAEQQNESQMGWDYQGSRFLRDIDFATVGRKAADRALALLGAEKTPSMKGSIVLEHSVAAEFLGILSSALSSESVQKMKSMFAGRLGQQVIAERLRIVDSGLIPGRLGSRPFDDEGVAMTEKTLVDHGFLKGFLYNTYTARKDGVVSTGNAVRGGFKGMPSVGPSNLYLDAASDSYREKADSLIRHIDRGLIVNEAMGMHTANPISGEFSVGVSGLWVESGKAVRPSKEAVISGNILDLFRNVVLVGDDLVFYGNIGAPSLLIEGIDISG